MISKILSKLLFYRNSLFLRFNFFVHSSWISLFANVRIEKTSSVICGKNVRISKYCNLYIGPDAILKLGDNVWIGPNCTIFCENKVTIFENCRIAHQSSIIDHDYCFDNSDDYFTKSKSTGTILVKENTWVGCSSIILKDTFIGKNCVIGANTLVKGKKIQDFSTIFSKSQYIIKAIE